MIKNSCVLMAHGAGGAQSRDFIERFILPRFPAQNPKNLRDATTLSVYETDILFTTDSFVVSPLEFEGGNIGDLCVHGTVNDLSVSGAFPMWLSLGLILEEGLEFSLLERILNSICNAAKNSRVDIVCGDTKVVPKGKGDQIYINTSGIGFSIPGFDLTLSRICPGDRILVNGTIGDHGMAVMAKRESFSLKNPPRTDSAPVNHLVWQLAELSSEVKFMRDPTRGGVSAVLNEIFSGHKCGACLFEKNLPFSDSSRAVAEMLGFDLLQVACEGRLIAIVSEKASKKILERWRQLPNGESACEIGVVTDVSSRVYVESLIGSRRILDVPAGELLPRIC